MNEDLDIHSPRLPRLTQPFALRELIAGREFEVGDQDYCEQDEYEDEGFDPEQLQNYINFDALDLDVDDNNKVICFSDVRKKMTALTDDEKVMKRIKTHGVGETVPSNSVVYYHYTAYVNLQEEPFDNSYLRSHRPQRLVLEKSGVILGLEIAIRSMKKGEVSQFIFDPEYAFGRSGCPPRVPADSTVLFEVELVDFVEVTDSDEMANILLHDENEDLATKFEKMYNAAKNNHRLGNDFFKKSNIKMAERKYRRAKDILLETSCKDDEDENKKNHLLIKIFTNLAVCYHNLNKPKLVCVVCKDAFYYNHDEAKKNAKLHYYWGLAMMQFSDFSAAQYKLKTALNLLPNDAKIKSALKQLEEKKRIYNQESKIMYRRALGLSAENDPVGFVDEKTDDSMETVSRMLKKKIEEATSGTSPTIEITIPKVLFNNIEDFYNELASKDINFVRRGNKIIIYKS